MAVVKAEVMITSTGYRLEYFDSGAEPKGAWALIFMHGKNFEPRAYQNLPASASDRFVQQGIRIFRPVMPWSSRWDGTHEDATSAIDALVELAAKDGRKVIVGGHSMGAMFTVLYRAQDLPKSVAGKFVSAPGHMLDLIDARSPFWNELNPSIERAKSLLKQGQGKEKVAFGGRNVVGAQNTVEAYNMTPEVYLSFHDPLLLPSNAKALSALSVPVLWTVGDRDPLINSNAGEATFRRAPSHAKSSFVVLPGKDHNSSLPASFALLFDWLKQLNQ